MALWWQSLTAIQQVFFVIAAPATVIMIIQTILAIFGMGDHSGGDTDTSGADAAGDIGDAGGAAETDGYADTAINDISREDLSAHDALSGLQLFTVRGVLAFLAIGGWAGMVAMDFGASVGVAVVVFLVFGSLALFGIAFLVRALLRLQTNAGTDYEHMRGTLAEVYLPIPAKGKGSGKVMMNYQEHYREYDAVSLKEAFKTGERVRVASVRDDHVLVVEKID